MPSEEDDDEDMEDDNDQIAEESLSSTGSDVNSTDGVDSSNPEMGQEDASDM